MILRRYSDFFKTIQALLPLLLLLLLPCVTIATTPTLNPNLKKCKFQEPWKFLSCYNETIDFPPYWITIIGILNVVCCTIFAFLVYPMFDFGWNVPHALTYSQEPEEHIPLQNIQPLALVEYENEPQSSLLPAISYFNLTGGDD
ncbi:16.5 kDa protein [Human mastadenovirus B]|uniref:16.5 kDa protein n=1 Tax=Human mastadenovirus B TaxID=108098 RepID=A0A0K0PX01_9ADEN|nr:16.5 kDa protein [Human mastadenovirus B]